MIFLRDPETALLILNATPIGFFTRPHINIGPVKHPITQGIGDFEVASEQYYMHVDPAVKVLATTRFPVAPGPHAANGPVDMPVIWTKVYGKGRVFYNSLGHHADVIEREPVLTLMRRGFAWAAAGKSA